ncbi:MAG: 50S ribosomal protein L29 [Rickettsiaceae bacterium]|nr:50S ribosomal protein L29 [Rickettsiaceae bacterium]
MNKKKIDISDLSEKQLIDLIANDKKQLMSLRFKLKLGELTNTSLFIKAKKNIARAYTELNKRKRV